MRAFLVLVAACKSPAPDPTPPEPEVPEGAADRGQRGSYFAANHDLCPSPACAGPRLTLVNHDAFPCPDGSGAHPTCGVDELDFSPSELAPEQQLAVAEAMFDGHVVLRGRVSSVPDPDLYGGTRETLHVSEAWLPGLDAAFIGTFAVERDNGQPCQSDPCPVWDEVVLNTPETAAVAELDFGPSGATDAEMERAVRASERRVGVIVAGDAYGVQGSDGPLPGRTVTSFWIRVRPE
jgi:hypothetical protein